MLKISNNKKSYHIICSYVIITAILSQNWPLSLRITRVRHLDADILTKYCKQITIMSTKCCLPVKIHVQQRSIFMLLMPKGKLPPISAPKLTPESYGFTLSFSNVNAAYQPLQDYSICCQIFQ